MSPAVHCRLRARRAASGLSQAALADRVGVSRQAIIAIEAGRQVPSTMLALQLARALDCRVDDLFSLGGALPATRVGEGPRFALGRVDGAWIAHTVDDPARAADGLAGAAGVEPLADLEVLARNVLVAGCAPLIGLVAGRLGPRAATWLPAHSARALELLERGEVHVAGLHLVDAGAPEGHAPLVRARFPGARTVVVNLARWRQGLVVAPGNPLGLRELEDVARPDVRFAGREPGSGTHALLERLGGVPPTTVVADGHAEVARLVRWGVVDVGVAIESAALAEGLDFVPLAEERFDLLVPATRAAHEPVARFIDSIDRAGFRAEAAHLPGYDLAIAGHAETVG